MTTKTETAFERLERELGPITFGSVLKSWRTADGISQTAFAKKMGLSVQNLNDLEKGRRIPSPSRAAKIAKKLGVSEMALIQLSLRDALKKEGFKYKVTLTA